jgi:hypothetical protein
MRQEGLGKLEKIHLIGTRSRDLLFFFYYLVCEAIGTAATPGLLCQPHMTRPGFEPGPPRWEAGE